MPATPFMLMLPYCLCSIMATKRLTQSELETSQVKFGRALQKTNF